VGVAALLAVAAGLRDQLEGKDLHGATPSGFEMSADCDFLLTPQCCINKSISLTEHCCNSFWSHFAKI
jgi:hypothetical protein